MLITNDELKALVLKNHLINETGLAEIFERKEVRWVLVLMVIPLFFYTLNFVSHNTLLIADWTPLL